MSTDVFGSPETLKAQDVVKAYEKIEKHIHRTPVLTSRTLDKIASTPRSPNTQAPRLRLHFKCENFQKIGAFKARGAFHALKCLVDAQGIDNIRSRGVVTHSSGQCLRTQAKHVRMIKMLMY